jgi:cytidylate kinase
MIIAIDGTAGSGKTTTAKEVAERLGFLHLDSGALYRAFAVAACRRGWAISAGAVAEERIPELEREAVTAEVQGASVTVFLDGQPLGEELRSPRVSACASAVSAFAEIRRRVDALLRHLAAECEGGVVCEGRDMGTVVFPDADLKVFMEAVPDERARRRVRQRGEEVTAEGVETEKQRLLARDTADSERDIAPLRRAAEALFIDTTDLTFDEQVERIVEAARRLDTT